MEQPPSIILIIDSDNASRNYLSAMLQKSGYTVLVTALGREGLISAWKDLPSVIILDPVLADLPGLDLVTRLRQDRRTSKVPIVALSSRENQQEMTDLLSAGCNEYMVKSSQAISKLLELLPSLLTPSASRPKKNGVLITFLSAKGGTGTSSLCANLAMCLASDKKEARVAVVDLVLPIGSIASIVGYNEQINLVTVAAKPPNQTTAVYFGDSLPKIPLWDFYLLAGSPDPESANQLDFGRIESMISAIRESHDFVFVDLGRGLSRISMPIIQRADLNALILNTDLACVSLTQIIWEYLKSQGVEERHVFPILNRAVGLEGMTRQEVEQMLGLNVPLAMPYLEGNFSLANNRHEPLVSKFANDSAILTLKEIATQMFDSTQKHRGR